MTQRRWILVLVALFCLAGFGLLVNDCRVVKTIPGEVKEYVDKNPEKLKGPQGYQGEPGEFGLPGEKGDTGEPGTPGVNGTNGANCFDGLTDQNGDGKIDVIDCRVLKVAEGEGEGEGAKASEGEGEGEGAAKVEPKKPEPKKPQPVVKPQPPRPAPPVRTEGPVVWQSVNVTVDGVETGGSEPEKGGSPLIGTINGSNTIVAPIQVRIGN
jgi:hypothetical protein